MTTRTREPETGAALARAAGAGDADALDALFRPKQVLFAMPAGPRVGTWQPHIMLYLPGLTAEEAGAAEVPGFSGIARPGSLLAHLIFVVNDWAKPAT